jgi:RHS repeat-associated protein
VPSVFYYVKDHLGTVHALVDASGSVVESYRFDPWGRVLGVFDSSGIQHPASSIGNRYLFQGREYSWATGLYYFRARWYDPVTGRWLSNDPIGISGGLNQYGFCDNDPLNLVDRFGLAEWKPVVHHTGGDGNPVYDGEQFVKWYTRYLRRTTFLSPWRMQRFLTDVDIKVYAQGIYYYKGVCWRHDEMGNIAAGYATVRVWGPRESGSAMFLVELAPLVDPVERPSSFREFLRNAWGSWSRNALGGVLGSVERWK